MADSPDSPDTVTVGAEYQSKRRVLLVDDDAETVEMMQMALSLYGFDAITATNVHDALALLRDRFDAVCTDLCMPGTDGFDLLRTVRGGKGVVLPIVVMSGQAPEQGIANALRLGACRYLRKPCEPDEVARTLHALIGCDGACATCVLRQR